MVENRFTLSQKDMPKQWYNIIPDLPAPPQPPLGPDRQPVGPEALTPIFPMGLIEQEVSGAPRIDIPEEIMDIYASWRPTPLVRAANLEKLLGTPAKIFYKYEGVSPAGSHKPNTAVPQAYYNKKEGVKRIATETGAGQWGSALSFACCRFGIECMVYMVKVSFDQKPYRKSLIKTWGANVVASPSNLTESGRKVLEADPNSSGSLGIAISEAVEDAAKRDDTKYALGSVLNHVLLHQTVIGQECVTAFEQLGIMPDIIIGCHGGGSNFAGLTFPFVPIKLGGRDIRIIAVEPKSCPTLTEGKYDYDFGDVAGLTPLMKMYTLGHDFMPPSIHAGGLRYHGAAPLVSLLLEQKVIEAVAYEQNVIFDSAIKFARCEGLVPAPESSHALHGAVVEALKCKETGEAKTILFGLSGHGYFDMAAYDEYLAGNLA